MARATEGLEEAAGPTPGTPEELAAAQEALLVVTAAGNKLARQLDLLAHRYSGSGLVQPSEVQVALDQAAAAAEDLGNCTKVAAQAIEDEREPRADAPPSGPGPQRTGEQDER
ncbi:hypothetical protein [Saccharopolyspora erythraea]|uniref:Uncharacterized protein n=2 Tax=Saccharopolyspora erythraea TaxID=1836 RepID=A4FFI7_SACEN|nr:hypothetical protein [Saccharopolyspora erythraea]QRK93023.1 hypothetical protein JQX30_18070 [Saccharopolyspora erythraea]CAM02812.1 hypothetical protein SACE_3538 [Saccharopolyspora erythraea NRRL 2338]